MLTYMELLNLELSFQQGNCYRHSTKMCCPPPTIAWSYISACAGVTSDTWAALFKDCMIELRTTHPEIHPKQIHTPKNLANMRLLNKNPNNPQL